MPGTPAPRGVVSLGMVVPPSRSGDGGGGRCVPVADAGDRPGGPALAAAVGVLGEPVAGVDLGGGDVITAAGRADRGVKDHPEPGSVGHAEASFAREVGEWFWLAGPGDGRLPGPALCLRCRSW